MCLRKRSSGNVLGWLLTVLGVVLVFGFVIQQNGKKQQVVENGATNYQHPRPQAQSQEPQDGEGEGENVGSEVPAHTKADYIGVWMGQTGMGLSVSLDFRDNDECYVGVADDPPVKNTYEIRGTGHAQVWAEGKKELIKCTISEGERGTYLDFDHYVGVVYDAKKNHFTYRGDTEHGTAMKR